MSTPMTLEAKIRHAAELGEKAFLDGRPAIPCFDEELATLTGRGSKVGDSIPFLKAWTSAWCEASCKAMQDAIAQDSAQDARDMAADRRNVAK